jgi:hypothetical protein
LLPTLAARRWSEGIHKRAYPKKKEKEKYWCVEVVVERHWPD